MRKDFTKNTSKILGERAGYVCSYHDCLVETRASTRRNQNKDHSAGISVAAHIYPASDNGPRADINITHEFIRSVGNGIWMCQNCASVIDNFRDNYPANKLLEMKLVREFSQQLSVTNPIFRGMAPYFPKKYLDNIVRKFLPNPEEKIELIKKEFTDLFIKWINLDKNLSGICELPKPPKEFSLSKVSTDLFGNKDGKTNYIEFIVTKDSKDDENAILELSTIISEFYDDKNVILSCRTTLQTLIDDTSKNRRPTVDLEVDLFRIRYKSENEDCIKIFTKKNIARSDIFSWSLESIIKNDICYFKSKLLTSSFHPPKNTFNLYSDKEKFSEITELIQYILKNNQLYGRIHITNPDRNTSIHFFESKIIKLSVETDINILDRLYKLSKKVLYGFTLSEEFRIDLHFTREFFDNSLSDALIKQEIIELINTAKEHGYSKEYLSKPIFRIDDKTTINIKFKNSHIKFTTNRL